MIKTLVPAKFRIEVGYKDRHASSWYEEYTYKLEELDTKSIIRFFKDMIDNFNKDCFNKKDSLRTLIRIQRLYTVTYKTKPVDHTYKTIYAIC